MKIKLRTITLQSFQSKHDEELLKQFKKGLSLLADRELSPRTYRIVSDCVKGSSSELSQSLKEYVEQAHAYGFWGIGLPFDVSGKDYLETMETLSKVPFATDENIFINLIPAEVGLINLKSIPAISSLIIQNSDTPINNFRLGVSSQKLLTPFFPFSCAQRHGEFVVGLELVSFITELVRENNRLDLNQLREKIITSLLTELSRIQESLKVIEQETGLIYGGLDLSLAPYPYPLEDQSVVTLIEEIGKIGRSRGEAVFEFGAGGTHFINSYLTDILGFIAKQDDTIKTVGFNGVMYSVLEDTYLSKRYMDDTFDINFLKLLSTTCGCGVDMVPLCGDVTNSSISGTIVDVISTAIILQKPLGVRLLPVANLRHGDLTKFKHLFFANTKVKEIKEGATFEYLPDQQASFSFKRNQHV